MPTIKEIMPESLFTIYLSTGATGRAGKDGKDGYTPQKGKDYFDGKDGKDYVLTEADKKEIGANLNDEYGIRITNNETYLDKLTPKNTLKGQPLYITDALELDTFENKIDGNSYQETTTGKNKLKNMRETATINGLTFTHNEDDSITVNGTATANTPYYFHSTVYGVALKFSEETTVICSGITTGSTSTYRIAYNYLLDNVEKSGPIILTKETSFKFPAGATIKAYIYVHKGTTLNNETFYPMIRDASVTDDTYEPFTNGASPNPDYPQEIEVLEGYNLFNINTITENKYINADIGSIGTSSASNISDYIEIKHYKKLTLTYNCVSLINTSNRAIAYYDANKNFLRGFSYNPTSKSVLIGTPSDAKFIRFTYDKSFYDIQVVEGTEIKPYLPYGCVGVKNIGKNLGCTYNNLGMYQTGAGQMGNFASDSSYLGAYCKVEAGKTYSISRNKLTSRFAVGVTKEIPSANTECLAITRKDSAYKLENITIPNDYCYIVLYLSNSGETSTGLDLQIEESPTATEYEPHQEQIVPLDLKGNFVGKIGDIQDYLLIHKNKYWLVKNVGKVVLDGSENWKKYSANNVENSHTYYLTFSDCKIGFQTSISSHFINKNYAWDGSLGIGIYSDHGSTRNKYFVTNIPTIEELKTWLSTHNVTVYYQLATPEIIELGGLPETIKTFEGVNNIQVLANLSTEIEVKYALDVKKYFDNKLAEISAQII